MHMSIRECVGLFLGERPGPLGSEREVGPVEGDRPEEGLRHLFILSTNSQSFMVR